MHCRSRCSIFGAFWPLKLRSPTASKIWSTAGIEKPRELASPRVWMTRPQSGSFRSTKVRNRLNFKSHHTGPGSSEEEKKQKAETPGAMFRTCMRDFRFPSLADRHRPNFCDPVEIFRAVGFVQWDAAHPHKYRHLRIPPIIRHPANPAGLRGGCHRLGAPFRTRFWSKMKTFPFLSEFGFLTAVLDLTAGYLRGKGAGWFFVKAHNPR